jgi:hypothetical protein
MRLAYFGSEEVQLTVVSRTCASSAVPAFFAYSSETGAPIKVIYKYQNQQKVW